MIASQTLLPGGPAITVQGSVISLFADGKEVLVGSKTEALGALLTPLSTGTRLGGTVEASGVTTAGNGIGGAIASQGGFAPVESTTIAGSSRYNGTMFIGSAARRGVGMGVCGVLIFVAWVGGLLYNSLLDIRF